MTFADNYNLRATTANFGNVADAIDASLPRFGIIASSSTINSTSTSYVDTDLSVTLSCASGEQVELTAALSFSTSNASSIFIALDYNGVAVSPPASGYDAVTGTNGRNQQLFLNTIITPSVGSNTFKLRWVKGSAGTMYSIYRMLTVKILQTS